MEVSRATCHATSSAPQVHLRHRVVRAFDGTHTITCAQRQQQLSRLLAMKDGVRRPVTLMDRRGMPLDARSADSSPARGSADASSRIRSRDPAAADLWSAAAGRCLWRPASSLGRAQVVDGRLYGWSGPRRRPAWRRGVLGRAHALPMCSTHSHRTSSKVVAEGLAMLIICIVSVPYDSTMYKVVSRLTCHCAFIYVHFLA